MPLKLRTGEEQSEEMKKDLKKLVIENLELTKELEKKVQKIYRFVVWQRILGVLKVLIILIPIILGIIYLPAILETYLGPYKELLEDAGGGGLNIKGLLNEIPKQR